MALDGSVVACIVKELSDKLAGGQINKIAQPEKDELVIHIRSSRNNYKLLLTAQASMPRIHLTTRPRSNPLTPPNFCMLMRKYLSSGRILSVEQPGFERIVVLRIEHMDEMGDRQVKRLIIEIMGRHSNIMLVNHEDIILESVRHISHQQSSVREVFPGRPYMAPPSQGKTSPLEVDSLESLKALLLPHHSLAKGIYMSMTGISPQLAEAICQEARLLGDAVPAELDSGAWTRCWQAFAGFRDKVASGSFEPTLYIGPDGQVKGFSAFPVDIYPDCSAKGFDSISELLDEYYERQSIQSRMSQKSSDLRRLVQNNLDRCLKKLDLQLLQMQDAQNLEKFRIRGELIHSHLYQLEQGMKEAAVHNYYTGEDVRIPLDEQLTPAKNAERYYEKYNKKKRTLEALKTQVEHTKAELDYLRSVQYSLVHAHEESVLGDIREELVSSGYMKARKLKGKKAEGKAQPYHYISSDGFHMYVGKNNLQNEYLSTKFASGSDWWFHAKEVPGSHVIVKSEGRELTDKAFEEAAALAAYYSQASDSPKVTVDYTLKKHLKKPNGSAPGYVIYHTNYSMHITPGIEGIQQA